MNLVDHTDYVIEPIHVGFSFSVFSFDQFFSSTAEIRAPARAMDRSTENTTDGAGNRPVFSKNEFLIVTNRLALRQKSDGLYQPEFPDS